MSSAAQFGITSQGGDMSKFAFQMDGDNPAGLWQGSGNVVPGGTMECTQAQAAEFSAKRTPFLPGSQIYRWTYIADVLAPVSDTRQRVTWGDPDGNGNVNGNGDVSFNLDVGDPQVNVSLSLPGTASRTDRLTFDGKMLKVVFVDGVATIPIKTDEARRLVLKTCDAFRVANTLSIRVNAVAL